MVHGLSWAFKYDRHPLKDLLDKHLDVYLTFVYIDELCIPTFYHEPARFLGPVRHMRLFG